MEKNKFVGQKQNILVTGSAGFIGSRTTRLLLDSGHQVIGVDDLNDYYDPLLKKKRLKDLVGFPEFHFQELDISHKDSVDRLFSDFHFDAVINLAARAGVRASIEDPHIYMSANATGTLNVLSGMVRQGIPKLVTASTSSLYAGQPMPFREDALVTRPISPYAASKLAAEGLAHVWHKLHGIDVSVVRYFTVYGPWGRPDMAPFRFSEWIRRGEPIVLYGDGTQTRDFTFIDDIARGTIAALKPAGFEIFNLGGGQKPLSVNQMIQLLEESLGKKAYIQQAPIQTTDMPDTSADVAKAKEILGWEPQVYPQEGLAQTGLWHRSNAEWLDAVQL